MSKIFGLDIDLNRNEAKNFRLENSLTFPSAAGGDSGLVFYHSGNSKFYGWDGSAWIDLSDTGGGGGGVDSFNARTGVVVPTAGDYDAFYYTEAETDSLLSGKANTSHTHLVADVTDFDPSDYVDKTNTESIGGLKTFTSPIHAGNGQFIFNDDAVPSGFASGAAFGYQGASIFYFYQDHANVNDTYGLLDFASLTAPRTYTFPNTTGTLALEGSFVELTGNQSVGGSKTFTSSCVFDATIRMPISTKAGGTTGVGGVGYIGTDQYIFYKDAEGRGMIFDFSAISAGALDRTYSFPNFDGGLVLDAGNQTIGGTKTFSSSMVLNGSLQAKGSIRLNSATALNNTIGFDDANALTWDVSGTFADNTFWMDVSGNPVFRRDGSNQGSFRLIHDGTTTNRSHTLPDKDGTIAHLSDIGTDPIGKAEGTITDPDFTSGDVDTTIISAQGAGTIIEIIDFHIYVTGWSSTGTAVLAALRFVTGDVGCSLARDIAGGTVSNITSMGYGYGLYEQIDGTVVNDAVRLRLTNTTAETTTGSIKYKVTYRVWTP